MKQTKRIKQAKRILSCMLVLLLLITQPAFAIGEYPEFPGMYNAQLDYTREVGSNNIPAGTLLIGTHLIYLPMITDKIYEMAMASASESGQTSMYYKSELAGGSWFEIGTATSVADISTTGAAVPFGVVQNLNVTHYTKADGITYLTLGGGYAEIPSGNGYGMGIALWSRDTPINVYTYQKVGSAVYDLPELISFKNTWSSFSNVSFVTMLETYQKLNNAWKSTVGDDNLLDKIHNYRLWLIQQGASKQELKVVEQIMDEIDNQRRIRVFKRCDEILKSATNEINNKSEEPPEILLMGMADTQKALRASIAKLQGKLMTSGTSTQEIFRYNIYTNVMSSMVNYASFWDDNALILYEHNFRYQLRQLVNLENIMASDIINREEELGMLNGNLLPTISQSYINALSLQTNQDYYLASQLPEAVALRERAVSENNGKINICQTELEQIILETVDRSSKEDSIAFINTRIDEANGYYKVILDGAFREGAVVSLDAHIEFLKRLLKSLTGEESPGEELQKEKLKLQDSLMEVLDENKTDEADEIRKKIDDVDEEIAALEEDNAYELAFLEEKIEKIEGELKKADEKEAEKLADDLAEAKEKLADVKEGAPDDSLIKVVEDLKKDGGDAVDRGDTGGADIVIESLIPIAKNDPRIVIPAIKDIHDKMVDKDGGKDFKDQINKAEDAIRDNAKAVTEATKPKKEREIELIVGEYDKKDDKRNAAVVAALGQYVYEEGGNNMEDLWKSWLDKLLADNNPYVFVRYNDGDNEYIPYDVLGYFANMRPVWYKTQQIGTLSKGGEYYSFKVASTKVGRDKDSTKSDEMKITAKWQDVVHVHESYTKIKFDCEAFYIPNSIYGVLVSPEIKVMLDEIMGKIEDAGKPK